MCKAAEVLEIEAKSDSLLVVSQVNGDYECKEASMRKYMCQIKDEIEPLKCFILEQVPRSKYHQADALSKLASWADCDAPRTLFREINSKKSIDPEQSCILAKERYGYSLS